MEVVFEKEFARISFDIESQLMYLELIGTINGEQYRETFNMLMEKGLEYNIKKLLVNQATMDKSSMESKAWLITSWLPKAKKKFGEDVKIALILSKNLFTKIGGEYIVSAVRTLSKFDLRTFSNFDEAKNWLIA